MLFDADVNTSKGLLSFIPPPPNSFPSSFTNNNQSAASGGASASVPTIPVSASLPSASTASGGFSELRSSSASRKARVLYDYDAASSSELSLLADEVNVPPNVWGGGATRGANRINAVSAFTGDHSQQRPRHGL